MAFYEAMVEIQGWLYGSATAALKGLSDGADFNALLAGLAFAAVFGFVHAFMPGHGKVALVSYYLGIRHGLSAALSPAPF